MSSKRVLVIALVALGFFCVIGQEAAAKKFTKSKLSYYVQVLRGDPSLGILLQPINASFSNAMGYTTIFNLNVTEAQSNTSTAVGFARGYTISTGYKVNEYSGFESEIISYDDGTYKGTIHFQAMLDGSSAEVAVLGGTGSFRGVRGWGTVTQVLLNPPYVVFYHQLHFMK
ncbi:hypothetical protein KP509_30G029700 [Ceratopteris richardii]|uniref:Dirigent protein n=1 Tax=Ceratopteris richardii TaxID=49495 RepID=A0A8T2R1X4_CERRI|nr:hypothetical protein KP509_30G029700 [Ceratopteris richardii]